MAFFLREFFAVALFPHLLSVVFLLALPLLALRALMDGHWSVPLERLGPLSLLRAWIQELDASGVDHSPASGNFSGW